MNLRKNKDENGSFCIGNMFVEEFLRDLSGDAVKLYLFLRYRQSEGLDIGSKIVMEKLRLTKDALFVAFKELTTVGLVEIIGDEMVLTSDSKLKDAKIEAIGKEFVKMLDGPGGDKIKKEYEDLTRSINNTFFDGRMGRQWYELIELCETIYRFEPETIYLLFSTCQKAKTSAAGYINYVKKVAESWYDNGITTEESAAQYAKKHGESLKYVEFVSKKLSLKRPFTQAEKDCIIEWKDKGINEDMLSVMLDDTNRVSAMTIGRINQETQKWISAGLLSKDDVIKFRENEKNTKKTLKTTDNQKTQKISNNGQIHFEGERKYDDEFYDLLMNNDFTNSDKKG